MSFRVTLVREGQHTSAKVVVFSQIPDIKDLQEIGSKKLRCTVRSLHLLDGFPLSNTSLQQLVPGPVTIVCSSKLSLPLTPTNTHASSSSPGQGAPEDQPGGISHMTNLETLSLSVARDQESLQPHQHDTCFDGAVDREDRHTSDNASAVQVPQDGSTIQSRHERPCGTPAAVVTVIAHKSMVELAAVKQLEEVARKFPCVRVAVGMPDLHPGPQFPIGAAFGVQGQVMPCLVGNDIGCGMSLFPTPIKSVSSKKAQKWAAQLPGMDRKWDGGTSEWLRKSGVAPTDFDDELGTVGGGNHFAELQLVDEVCDQEAFEQLGLKVNSTYLLVHSGSRALGQSVLKQHLDAHGTRPLDVSDPACADYLHRHDAAVAWAGNNRRLIAYRFLSCLGCDPDDIQLEPIIDICHNSVVKKSAGWGADGREETLWLHRKGAAPIDSGPVVIPGSRGAYSFIVAPGHNHEKLKEAAYSVAHGAGRKWSRSHAEGVGKTRFPNPRALCTTNFGGAVVCDDTSLLYQEQPDAYKEITDIIADLEEHGAARVVAVMRPILTYKTRK